MIETKKPSSLEEKLKLKITQKDPVYSDDKINHAFIGQIETPVGLVSVLSTEMVTKDLWTSLKARMGIRRNDYAIPPGIYAVGKPDKDAPVLVTSNYKLTLDKLRIELKDMNLWILVIDTKGVNVWCAAGKGTFSTEEIIYRVKKHKLANLVAHKTLILPQLGAPGISAYQMSKFTGFKAIYGPVYSRDIREFLKKDFTATDEMRKVRFNLTDRLEVSLLETVMAVKFLPYIFLIFAALKFITGGYNLVALVSEALQNTMAYGIAILIGTIVFPAVLPFLPFSMFTAKAGLLGIVWSILVMANARVFGFESDIFSSSSNLLLMTSLVGYIGLNYTGSTTFTSLTGVKKETRAVIPVLISMVVLGVGLIIIRTVFIRI